MRARHGFTIVETTLVIALSSALAAISLPRAWSFIDRMLAAKKDGLTIVPLKLLNRGKYIKLVISLAKGKKNYDKRQTLKKRAESRDVARELKNR